jgi:hypothetical protein
MVSTPTPTSTLRTLVLVSPHALAGAAGWSSITSFAFAAGALEVGIVGRATFVFAQPLDALRFVLELPRLAPGCRVVAHVGELLPLQVDPQHVAHGARAQQADSADFEVLKRLLDGCSPSQRLLSRPAAALLRRAAQGQSFAMPDGWDCHVGSGDTALPALSLDEPTDVRRNDGIATLNSRQPLPSRPHWWLERRLPDAGPLQRALLRNHKSGLHALLQMANDEDGRTVLLAQREALSNDAIARDSLELGDGQLDALPAFLVSELGGACLLGDWLGTQPLDSDAALALLRTLGRMLAAVHAAGCAHGAFDVQAVARTPDDRLRLYGIRRVTDPGRLATLQQQDCAALAGLLFGLLAGDPQARPDAFWERRVTSSAARELIATCLDPDHPQPVRDMHALCDAMHRLGAVSASHGNATSPMRRGGWWPWRARR